MMVQRSVSSTTQRTKRTIWLSTFLTNPRRLNTCAAGLEGTFLLAGANTQGSSVKNASHGLQALTVMHSALNRENTDRYRGNPPLTYENDASKAEV